MDVATFAGSAHHGQLRQNGAPYIIHPLAVAGIVSDWQLDIDSIKAALLHDVVEDTSYSLDDLESRFGKIVTQIVNGVSKIEQLEQFEKGVVENEHQATAENYRKMLLAISRDWRVILIKLADRLHNMRTLGNLKSENKRKRIAKETLEIYAPIAERLGFQPVRDELQSLAFKHIYPWRYTVLENALQRSNMHNRITLPKIKRQITIALRKAGIKVVISVRSKNVYSVYRKMIEKNLTFNEVDDIIGFRLVVDSRLECYTVLGVMHEKLRPVPGKLKDYISQAKINGYQSLHTTVLAYNGTIIELQIRTEEMDRFAEYGLAAHWDYKERYEANNKRKRTKKSDPMQSYTNRTLSSLMTMSKLGVDPQDFLSNLRLDLFPNDVFVLTPKGKVIQLINGSTALDMAYAIHSDLGDKADYAIINAHRMPISAQLSSGDITKIITSATTSPSPHWLTFVASPKARTQIRAKLKQSKTTELAKLGRQLVEDSLHRLGRHPTDITDTTLIEYFKHNKSLSSPEDLYSKIALGLYQADVVVKEILGPVTSRIAKYAKLSISVVGDNRAGITRATCCEPLPPEPIVGIMKQRKGLIVHLRDCPRIAKFISTDHFISMHWGKGDTDTSYRVHLELECTNRKGLLANVITVFPHEQVNIVSVNLADAEGNNPVAIIKVVAEVVDAQQIERLVRRINEIKGVTVKHAGARPTPFLATGRI